MKNLLITLLVLVFAGCALKENCMAVEFANDTTYINFTQNELIADSLSKITITGWVKLDSSITTQGGIALAYDYNDDGDTLINVIFDLTVDATNRLSLYTYKAIVANGHWITANNSISNSVFTHVAITFDLSTTSTQPVMYVNGVSKAVTEVDSQAVSVLPITNIRRVVIGGDDLIGSLQDVRIYDRILSANEILALYNSRCLRNVMSGLVFWAPMWGAESDTFDGLTLTSSHKIANWAGGASGVPAGSPIGRGNTIQGN